jgi:hypothetical protein
VYQFFIFIKKQLERRGIVAGMQISYDSNYPNVEINFSGNGEREDYSIKLPMSKMWYKDIIYEIEKVAEEEKKKAAKYLHENNRQMLTQSFDMYAKLMGISNELRRNSEIDSDFASLSEASGKL